jgi:hypothetical protein
LENAIYAEEITEERDVVGQLYVKGIETEEAQPTPALTSEQQFLLAILRQALADLRSPDETLAREAWEFVHSEACAGLCDWLGYPAEPLRQFVARNGTMPRRRGSVAGQTRAPGDRRQKPCAGDEWCA